jgi:hypothetical protein
VDELMAEAMEEEAEGVIWGSFNEEMWGIGELTNSKI